LKKVETVKRWSLLPLSPQCRIKDFHDPLRAEQLKNGFKYPKVLKIVKNI